VSPVTFRSVIQTSCQRDVVRSAIGSSHAAANIALLLSTHPQQGPTPHERGPALDPHVLQASDQP
jgi:hypothetical protein